jgi:hypothetical protein
MRSGSSKFDWIKAILAENEGDRDIPQPDIDVVDLIRRHSELAREIELSRQALKKWPLAADAVTGNSCRSQLDDSGKVSH